MPLIVIVLGLVCIGVLLWLMETRIPMDPFIKQVIHVVVIVCVVVFLLRQFGLWDAMLSIRV